MSVTELRQKMSVLSHLMHTISDHGNVIASKFITWVGVASVGTGGVIGVTQDTASRITDPSLWGLPDYAAVVAMCGGVTLIIKNVVDVYYTLKNKGAK
jgi:hypothetical protein